MKIGLKSLALGLLLASAATIAPMPLMQLAHADATPECNDSGLHGTACGTNSSTGQAQFATAVGYEAEASGYSSVAVGESAQATNFGAVAVGTRSRATGMNSTAVGEDARATEITATAIGSRSRATAQGSVSLGEGSLNDRANTVSVGSSGHERQIANVAAGTALTDAVNVAQLNSATASLQGQITGLGIRLDDDIDRVNEGVALSLAMETPSIPQGARYAISGGVGYFNERSAASMAFSARTGRMSSFSAGIGVGFNSGEVGARAGFQHAW